MLRVRYLSVFLFALFVFSAQAQTTKITAPNAFAENPIVLDFSGFQEGADVGDVYSRWGVTFTGIEGTVPGIVVLSPPVGGVPEHQYNRVVRNVGPAGLAKALPLVISFKYPVSKVAFKATNAPSSSVNASLTAYDPAGKSLGSVTQSGLDEEKFFGLSTTNARGIGKIALDYGAVEAAEQIDNLTFEYLARPPFTTYLAQVADYQDMLQTILVVSNLTNSTAQGEIRLFTPQGGSLSIETDQGTHDTFPFQIPPFSSKTITSSGKSTDVKVGYGIIDSNVPVEGSAIFRVINASGATLQEAGVGATPAQFQAIGVAQKQAEAGFDTGLAIVNPSDQAAEITAYLYNEQGSLVSVNETDLDLAAGKQMAKFLTELFTNEAAGDFRGTLVITSTQPIAVVVLRTLGGIASSTLPVGNTSR